MLLVQRSARRAVHVPLFLMSFSGVIAVVSLVGLLHRPGVGTAIAAAITPLIFLAVSRDLRSVAAYDGALIVRGPGLHRRLSLAQCALGVRVVRGTSDGATYTVFANDGVVSADISEHWSARSAERAVARLGALLPVPVERAPMR